MHAASHMHSVLCMSVLRIDGWETDDRRSQHTCCCVHLQSHTTRDTCTHVKTECTHVVDAHMCMSRLICAAHPHVMPLMLPPVTSSIGDLLCSGVVCCVHPWALVTCHGCDAIVHIIHTYICTCTYIHIPACSLVNHGCSSHRRCQTQACVGYSHSNNSNNMYSEEIIV